MPHDSVRLEVDGKRIEHFLSYQIASDLYVADDMFHLQLANPEIPVKPGVPCKLYVNDELALTGIVDGVTKSYGKEGVKTTLVGRDLMGLLVDAHCETFKTVKGMRLKDLAEFLLKDIPFINREGIVYQENVVGAIKRRKAMNKGAGFLEVTDKSQRLAQIEPGMTVFEVLKEYATSRGMLFYSLPDGTFTFGTPKVSGEPLFKIICNRNGSAFHAMEGERADNIAKRYSRVAVIGQQQGGDIFSPQQINTKAVVEDGTFPFRKVFVGRNQNDFQSPKLHARMLMEKMRNEGFCVRYKVPFHSQDGKNWTVNELVKVQDEVLELDTVLLVYSRTFEMSKEGLSTHLRLGYPGMLQ